MIHTNVKTRFASTQAGCPPLWSAARTCRRGILASAAVLCLTGCISAPPPSSGNTNSNSNDNTVANDNENSNDNTVANDNGNDNQNSNGDATVNDISLRHIADGLTSPVGLVPVGDGTGRFVVLDQVGRAHILDAEGNLLPTPFLDLTGRVIELQPEFDERGLLGLAFHPDYAVNGRFFVFYSMPPDPEAADPGFEVNCRSRISEFRVSDDPNLADVDSERVLLEIPKPQFNHNGGQLGFGPTDGFLYISVGDGGGAGDVGDGHNPEIGNSQDPTTLLGKLLRIDVDGDEPYAIPADNPFVDEAGTRPEIWALGLRNPWRFSFDRGDAERLFIADVGQDLFEEVSLGRSGVNYGWFIREGAHCFDPDTPVAPPEDCADADADGRPLVDPVFEYNHLNNLGEIVRTSITGGFIYRGTEVAGLEGDYVFGDYSVGFSEADGTLLAARENADGTWTLRELRVAGDPDGRIGRFILSFGEDADGELYVLTTGNLGPQGTTGEIHRIEGAP